MTKREEIIRIFPESMKPRWEQALLHVDKLQEIRLGVGQPVRLITAGGERFLSGKGNVGRDWQDAWYMTERDIEDTI